MIIDSFKGENRWLSNFHMADVEYEGLIYPSTEHAYQAAKSLDPNVRKKIQSEPKPGGAKRLGNRVTVRPDWLTKKLEVMEDVVRKKFTNHKDIQEKLLATGDAELIEGNTWGDVFWGICDGKGENHLGKILMKVRKELRGKTESESTV